jgi:glycosyltransferase involved in cell wall biosynthesis
MNIISPINQLGYGVAGLNITKKLVEKTLVSLWPIGQPQVTNEQDANIITKCMMNTHQFECEDPCVRIWHQHDMAQFVGHGTKIGFPFFELDAFNPTERHHLNSVDRIFVSSEWAKQVCLANNIRTKKSQFGKDEIYVVPLGVDTQMFEPCKLSDSNKTIFFNCGKWEIRKGHDILCDIFNSAFSEDDDVELWLMTTNPFLTPEQDLEWKKLYTNSKLGNKVRFIERVQTQKEVYNIMSQSDCGVFPSRAEGWNLELLEMLSCGKHVIATNYSAHTEFCNHENARLVTPNGLEMAFDGKWFHGKCGKWAEIDSSNIAEFVDHMKDVYALKQSRKLGINHAGIETGKKYTWDNTANKILEYAHVQ